MTAALPLLKKVQGLIGLTASDRMEEARTSAYLACKIIRENNLQVVDQLPSNGSWSPRTTDPAESRPKIIRAKFDSTCVDCRAWIYIGDRCVWIKGRGVWHPECTP